MTPSLKRFALLGLAWLGLVAASGARAPDADIQGLLAQATADLHGASAGSRTDELSDGDIKARLTAIGPVESRLATALADLAPRLQDAENHLAQLGPAPIAPRREDSATAALRRQYERNVAIFQADEREARLLSLQGQQAADVLTERMRANFSARLTAQSRSFLDPSLWRNLLLGLPADLGRLTSFVGDEADALVDKAISVRDIAIGGVALAVALLLLGPARILLIRLAYRRARKDEKRTRLTCASLALWRVAVGTATPLLALLALHAGLLEIDALTDVADDLANLFIRAATFGAFIDALGRALLSPSRPQWRLAPIPDELANRLGPFPALIGAAAALGAFIAGFNAALGASVSAQVVSDYAAVALEAAAVAGTLIAMGRTRAVQREAPEAAPARMTWVLTALAGWLAIAMAVLAMLIGYLAFASFVMREAIWIAAVLGLLFMLVRFTDELIPAVLAPTAPLGSALESGLGVSREFVLQLAVLGTGLARLVLIIFGWAAVVAPFGASAGDIFGRVTSSHFAFRLGKTEVSPGAVLGAVALFFLGLGITRAIRGWLVSRYLPSTQLDVGVRTSLAAGVTYAGALIAILVAFATLGLSLSQIALFASALSVGIGFGLQAIIGNFVSGLILLAERPVRVGDWVAIGDQQGDVKKISIRATEIELFDRSRLIVPNTDLVTKAVRNVTHVGGMARVGIVLKVAADADPHMVRELILQRLHDHKLVLHDPEPKVFLTDVGAGFLEFTAYGYIFSARNVVEVKSELLLQLIPELREKGVTFSINTTVVNVGPRGETPAPTDALAGASAAVGPKA